MVVVVGFLVVGLEVFGLVVVGFVVTAAVGDTVGLAKGIAVGVTVGTFVWVAATVGVRVEDRAQVPNVLDSLDVINSPPVRVVTPSTTTAYETAPLKQQIPSP